MCQPCLIVEIGDGCTEGKQLVEVEQQFYRNIDHGYATPSKNYPASEMRDNPK